jgi:receptor protein-tyrosine kinase
MSKIFDALRKTDLLESADLAEPVLTSRKVDSNALPTMEPANAAVAVALEAPKTGTPETLRTAALKISALAPIFPLDDAQPIAAEQYRIIRTKIMQHPAKPRVIVVSSATSGDGKTVTAINIAACLALKPDTSVLLIDADLRRPMISNLLGVPAAPGLADVLAGRCTSADAVIQTEQFPNLSVLVAGEKKENPAELLDSPRWRALIEEFRRQYRFVIMDATPVAAVADYALVQAACDGVALVVRQDHTERALLNNALRVVPKDRLLGTVLNCVENWFLWKTHGYGYYKGKK